MQIKIRGEWTMAELRQAIFEKLCELENEYTVRHAQGTTIYLTPTNGFGEEIKPMHHSGGEIQKMFSSGPYKSAADEYTP